MGNLEIILFNLSINKLDFIAIIAQIYGHMGLKMVRKY